MFRRAATFIGIDIRAEGIGLMKVIHEKKAILIDTVCYHPFPLGVFNEGKMIQLEVIAAGLNTLIQQNQARGYPIATALPVHYTLIQKITQDDELSSIEKEWDIEEKLRTDFPLESGPLFYDFASIPPSASFKNTLLVFGRSEQIAPYLYIFSKTRQKLRVIDIDIYALMRTVLQTLSVKTLSVLYRTASYDQFIVFFENEILAHHLWMRSPLHDLDQKIKKIVFQLSSLYPNYELNHLTVLGPADSSLLTEFPVHYCDPFATATFSATAKLRVQEDPSKWFICYGLTLRQFPAW